MATALRISRLSSGGGILLNVDFSEAETREVDPRYHQPSRTERAQRGAPTLQRFGSGLRIITVTINLLTSDTQDRLNQLLSGARSLAEFRVYPKYQEAPGTYHDCYMVDDAPSRAFFAGQVESEQTITLTFYEAA